jgi:hypothetical protein
MSGDIFKQRQAHKVGTNGKKSLTTANDTKEN